MRRLALRFALVLALLAMPVGAAPVAVETGEHDGFTRIVLRPSSPLDWRLGRRADGYELRVAGSGELFSVAGAYRKIGRSRLADLAVTPDGRGLSLTLGCDCHARAFSMKSGVVVIDISDGPAPKNSAFERPLDDPGGEAPPSGQTAAAAEGHPAAPSGPQDGPAGPSSGAAVGSLLPAAAPLFPAVTGGAWPSLPSPFAPENYRTAAAGEAPAANGAPTLAGPEPEARPDADVTSVSGLPAPSTPETAPLPAAELPAETGAPASVPRLPSLPAPSAQAAEADLFRQLSRAASQGFVELAEPIAPAPQARPNAPAPDAAAPQDTVELPQEVDKGAAFRIQTSLDRDTPSPVNDRLATASGTPCPTDDRLAFAAWVGDRPAADQIAEARAALLGEFDRADPEAVGRLARLYLGLGMGAEARQVLQSFPVAVPDGRILSDIGHVLEEEPVAETSPLNGLRDCESNVALWAFLAAPDAAAVRLADSRAIVRGFSALPLPLRSLLARRLVLRLNEIGAAEAARSVRNALARDQGADPRLVSLLDAERALGGRSADTRAGEGTRAEPPEAGSGAGGAAAKAGAGAGSTGPAEEAAFAALESVAQGADPLSDSARLSLAEQSNRRRQPLSDADFMALAALAKERLAAPEGPALVRAMTLAQALRGEYDTAFAALSDQRNPAPDHDTLEAFAAILATGGEDDTVVRLALARPNPLDALPADSSARLDLARRVAHAGFAASALGLLTEDARQTETGRLIGAQAALDAGDGPAALALLDEIGGPRTQADQEEAARLRAAALVATGAGAQAAPILQALGDKDAAAAAAWSAGDWTGAAQSSEQIKGAVDSLGLASPPATEAPQGSTATLAASRGLLTESAKARETLEQLLGPADGAVASRAPAKAAQGSAPVAASPTP